MKKLTLRGILRVLLAKVSELTVNNIGDVTAEELSTLQGITENIQTQLTTLKEQMDSEQEEQTNFKNTVASAINTKMERPLNNPAVLSWMSAEQFKDAIDGIKTGDDTSDATATASNILQGKTAYAKGAKLTGTMVHNSGVTVPLNCGGSYTIPVGYHDGSGKVAANSLSSQTQATAVAGNILSGKTAYVNGSKVTGTMTNQGAQTGRLACDDVYTIPAGYHNGSGKITAIDLYSQTHGTATAADIAYRKTAWVYGDILTGTSHIGSMINKLYTELSKYNINTFFLPMGDRSKVFDVYGTSGGRPTYNITAVNYIYTTAKNNATASILPIVDDQYFPKASAIPAIEKRCFPGANGNIEYVLTVDATIESVGIATVGIYVGGKYRNYIFIRYI